MADCFSGFSIVLGTRHSRLPIARNIGIATDNNVLILSRSKFYKYNIAA